MAWNGQDLWQPGCGRLHDKLSGRPCADRWPQPPRPEHCRAAACPIRSSPRDRVRSRRVFAGWMVRIFSQRDRLTPLDVTICTRYTCLQEHYSPIGAGSRYSISGPKRIDIVIRALFATPGGAKTTPDRSYRVHPGASIICPTNDPSVTRSS